MYLICAVCKSTTETTATVLISYLEDCSGHCLLSPQDNIILNWDNKLKPLSYQIVLRQNVVRQQELENEIQPYSILFISAGMHLITNFIINLSIYNKSISSTEGLHDLQSPSRVPRAQNEPQIVFFFLSDQPLKFKFLM